MLKKKIILGVFIILSAIQGFGQKMDLAQFKPLIDIFSDPEMMNKIRSLSDSAKIKLSTTVHFNDSDALIPYIIELKALQKVEKADPGILLTINLTPGPEGWQKLIDYKISISAEASKSLEPLNPVIQMAVEKVNVQLQKVDLTKALVVKDAVIRFIRYLRINILHEMPVDILYTDMARADFLQANAADGFDARKYKQLDKYYDKVETVTKENYFVSWLRVEDGKQAAVKAVLAFKDSKINTDSVVFRDVLEQKVNAVKGANNEWTLSFTPSTNPRNYIVVYVIGKNKEGIRTEFPVGMLNVAAYEHIQNKLVIVPLKGVSATLETDITAKINEIYGQSGISWTVEQKKELDVPGYDFASKAVVISRTATSRYSEEMQAVISAQEAAEGYDENAYYLFIAAKADDAAVKGYMPKNKKYGFLFPGSKSEIKALSAAHELGHGAFCLPHPWDEYGFGEKDITDNLMGYNDSSALWKVQWEWMHDRGMGIYAFEGEEKNKLAVVNMMSELSVFKNPDNTFTFIAPSGFPITLPEDVQTVGFATGENIKSNEFFTLAPFGTLVIFTLNKQIYQARFSLTNNEFLYYENNKSEKYYDKYSPISKPVKGIVGLPCYINDGVMYKAFQKESKVQTEYPTSYTAGGILEWYDFIKSPISNFQKQGTEVEIAATMNLSEEALEYLNWRKDYASCDSKYSLYVFINAFQISYNPGTYYLCKGEDDSRYNAENPNYQYPRKALDFLQQQNKIYYTDEELFNELKRWSDENPVYWKRSLAIKKLNTLGSEEDVKEIRKTLETLDEYQCVWYDMNINTRLHCLQKLITDGDDELINKLITSTGITDRSYVIDELKKNNSELFFKAYDNMSGDDLDIFISVLSDWVVAINTYEVTNVEGLVEGPSITDGKTSYPFEYISWRLGEGIIGRNFKRNDNSLLVLSNNSLIDYIEINPFKIVKIRFNDNFQGGISAGTDYVVPAFWAYRFQKKFYANEAVKGFKVLAEAGLIILTVGTSTPVIAAIEATVLATDIIITAKTTEIVKCYGADGETFLKDWNELAGAVLLMTSGVSIVENVLKINLNNFISEFKLISIENQEKSIISLNKLFTSLYKIGTTKNIIKYESAYYAFTNLVRTAQIQTLEKTAMGPVLSVKDLVKVIIKDQQVATVMTTGAKLVLKDIKWLPFNAPTDLKSIQSISPVSYVNVVGETVNAGTLEIYEFSNSIFFKEFVIRQSVLESLKPGSKILYDNFVNAGYVVDISDNVIYFKGANNQFIARLKDDLISIKIPDLHGGWATQSSTPEALLALQKVKDGANLYRIGTLGQSAAAEAQYWAPENPLNITDIKQFAEKYGIPEENLKTGDFFVEIAKPKNVLTLISREAPSYGGNLGGSVEIVVPLNGVILESFHTIKF